MSTVNISPKELVRIEILFAADESYFRLLLTAMASVLKNAKSDELPRFHIIDGGLTEKTRQMIDKLRSIRQFELCYYKPNVESYKKRFPNYSSYATFYRLMASALLPEMIDRVIYIDCDVLVLSSLQELWNAPLGDLFCAAVYDGYEPNNIRQVLDVPENYRYFNAGVLLINLRLWREKDLAAKFLQIAVEREGRLPLADQDVLNVYAASNGYLELERRWNLYAGELVDCRMQGILHYWQRFWFWWAMRNAQGRLLRKYAALTPFKKFPHHRLSAMAYRYYVRVLSLFVFPRSRSKEFWKKRIAKTFKF